MLTVNEMLDRYEHALPEILGAGFTSQVQRLQGQTVQFTVIWRKEWKVIPVPLNSRPK